MTSSGPSPAGATSGAPANQPRNLKLAITSPGPTGATSGAPANKPRNRKLTISGLGPAGATSGAPANKPRNNKIRTPHSICACGCLHKNSPHTTRHTMHTQKLAHRREFAHAHAHPDKHHTQQDTQCTHKNLHTAGSFRMRTRTQTNTTRIKTHNAHTKTCTPQGVCECARARRHTRDTQCTRENLRTAQQMCMRTLTKAFNAHKKKRKKGGAAH